MTNSTWEKNKIFKGKFIKSWWSLNLRLYRISNWPEGGNVRVEKQSLLETQLWKPGVEGSLSQACLDTVFMRAGWGRSYQSDHHEARRLRRSERKTWGWGEEMPVSASLHEEMEWKKVNRLKSNNEWWFLFSPSDTARSPVSPKTSLKVRLGALKEGWHAAFSSKWRICANLWVCVGGFFGLFFGTSDELHAEVCYAECLLQRAALTFLQVSEHFRTVTHLHGGTKSKRKTLSLSLCV